MLAARITLPHFSVSSAMSFPKSAGEPGKHRAAQVGKPRLMSLGSASAALISLLSLSMTSARRALRRADAVPVLAS